MIVQPATLKARVTKTMTTKDLIDQAAHEHAAAWDAWENVKPGDAYARLHTSVGLILHALQSLEADFEKAEAGNRRTANIASCLANGIQPD